MERTNINNYDRTSKFRAISDVLTNEAIALREEQIASAYSYQLEKANGEYLDKIGERFFPRIKIRHAFSNESERSIAFYVETGTFGDINSSSNIVLSSNVIVSSEPNANEFNSTVDYNITPTTLLSNESIHYVSARATNAGSQSNVGSSVLRVHNFTNYTDSANGSLKVINFYPILNGVNEESDDSYRSRLANFYNRQITNNETRLKLTALDIPGVLDTRIVPGYYGIGSAAVFALGPEYQTNTNVINALQDRLDDWKSPGASFVATPATEVTFDFNIELAPIKSLSNTQLIRLKTQVNKAFLEYFGSLRIGSLVSLDDLLSLVQKRISTIAAFTQVGGDRVFKQVFIRRRPASGLPEEQSKLVTRSYSLDLYEFAGLGTLDIQVV